MSTSRPCLLCLTSGLLALTLQTTAMAQNRAPGTIEGRVVPRHDHDFVLATAGVPDLALRVEIDGDGSFRFDEVRPGTYAVEVSVPSLGTAVEVATVRAGETTTLEIELLPGGHFDEIVVTGSAIARDPLELTSPTTSLSGQELVLRRESTLGETLSGEPGISSTFFGPGASRPIIRGLAGDRVRMLESGIDTGDAAGVSADHAVTVDPAQAERIEVIRGPATLLYGSSAIGGVVNVIDGRIPTSRATGSINGHVELRGGSVGSERQGAVTLEGGRDNWAWHLDGVVRDADDYEIPGAAAVIDDGNDDGNGDGEGPRGTVPNTDVETEGFRAGFSYFFGDRGFLGAAWSGFDSEYGIPSSGEDAEAPVRIDIEQRRLDLRGEITRPFGFFQGLRLRIGGTDYEHVELEGDEIGTRFMNDLLEGRVELVQKARRGHTGSIGIQVVDRDLDAIGDEAFLPATSTGRFAVFALQELERGPLRWQLGARFESQDIDPDGADSRSHEGLSGSMGLVWTIDDTWSLASSLSRSVKLPAPEELFSDGLHVATQAFEIGDAALDEEESLGLDVSIRKREGRLTGELTFFRQAFDGFIFQAFTGDQAEGFPVVRYSQEDATFQGVELKARVELIEREGHHIHLQLVGDTVNAALDSGGDLPRIPPMRLGGGVHYHSERWNASAEMRWVDDQDDIGVNETPTDGHTMIHASVGHRFLFRKQIVDVLLRGRNLTDQDARAHTSFLKRFAPLPGRDISINVRLQF